MTNEEMIKLATLATGIDEMHITPIIENGEVKRFGEFLKDWIKVETDILNTKIEIMTKITNEIKKRID